MANFACGQIIILASNAKTRGLATKSIIMMMPEVNALEPIHQQKNPIKTTPIF
jgi:hypothetical protein